MPQFLSNLLRSLRGAGGTDMRLVCRQLLSQRGEASQTALAQRIIAEYKAMDSSRRIEFFEMLSREFGPDQSAIQNAIEEYERSASQASAAALGVAAEAPRQELFRRLNTAPAAPESLVPIANYLLRTLS